MNHIELAQLLTAFIPDFHVEKIFWQLNYFYVDYQDHVLTTSGVAHIYAPSHNIQLAAKNMIAMQLKRRIMRQLDQEPALNTGEHAHD